MKHLVWFIFVAGSLAHANQTFNCGGDGDYVLKDLVTVTDSEKVFLTEYTSSGKDRREMIFVDRMQGDYVYEKQVVSVRFKKADDGLIVDVRLITDGEKPRFCEEQ